MFALLPLCALESLVKCLRLSLQQTQPFTNLEVAWMIPSAELVARREALIARMVPNSVAIVPANNEVVRSNDTHYDFRQESDYWYCTGVNEPDGVLLAFKGSDAAAHSVLFVLPRSLSDEIWHGRRLGEEQAKQQAAVDRCESLDDLDDLLPELLDGYTDLYI